MRNMGMIIFSSALFHCVAHANISELKRNHQHGSQDAGASRIKMHGT